MAKEIEILPPQQFILLVQSRISDLEHALKLQNHSIKNAPPGKIRIVHNKGQLQFYLREQASDLQGKYLPRSKEKLALALIQKDYNQKSVEAMTEELNFLKDFLSSYNSKSAASAYDKLLTLRQYLSTPVTLSDSQYAEKWLSVESL